jgi:hypothetical protein
MFLQREGLAMKRIAVGLAALVLLACGAVQARASFVVYTTFGPNDSYVPNGGTTVSGSSTFGGYNAAANGFTTQQTVTLDQVRVAVFGTPGFLIDVLLAQDDGGVRPGTILETVGQISVPGFSAMIFTLNSSTHSTLTAGDAYWLILQAHDPNTSDGAGWNTSDPPHPGLLTVKHDPTGDWPSGGTVMAQGAFEVSGTPTVPEPASLALLGLGMAGLLGYGWRQQRKLSMSL